MTRLLPLLLAVTAGLFAETNAELKEQVRRTETAFAKTLAKLRKSGVELIDSEARVGIWGSRVAFLHPKATGGALTELVQPVEGDWRRRGGSDG